MKPIYLQLEDGAVFEGRYVNEARECAGLLSFYTGTVGFQEVVSDPANLGKIILFTYPMIGACGVSDARTESASAKVMAVVTREYTPYSYACGNATTLADYLGESGVLLGTSFDTRAILVYLREHGEMKAVISLDRLDAQEVQNRTDKLAHPDYEPENPPLPCDNPKVGAAIMDLGASRTFFRRMAELGVRDGLNPNEADIVIISDTPYYLVEDREIISQIHGWLGKKPVIGFGHGAAIVAKACGANAPWLEFGDHGLNIPVRYVSGGNEITTQNHNYGVVTNDRMETLFVNVNDGSCEGFYSEEMNAAGVNFIPPSDNWFNVLLDAVGVA